MLFERYYLLVKTKPTDFVDVQGMTKRSCLLVWFITIPFVLSSHLLAFAVIVAGNWQDRAYIPKVKDMERSVLTSAMLISTLFFNIPDFISIAFYVKMSRHFLKRSKMVNSIPDGPPENLNAGAWMGDLEPNMAVPSQPATSNEARLVMSKLGLHMSTTLLDLAASLANAFLAQTLLGSILTKVYMVVFCFWLPLVVVKVNVRELDGMAEYITDAIKCKHGNDDN